MGDPMRHDEGVDQRFISTISLKIDVSLKIEVEWSIIGHHHTDHVVRGVLSDVLKIFSENHVGIDVDVPFVRYSRLVDLQTFVVDRKIGKFSFRDEIEISADSIRICSDCRECYLTYLWRVLLCRKNVYALSRLGRHRLEAIK